MRYKLVLALFAAILFAHCHAENNGQKIEKLEFQEKIKTVKVGESAAVGIKVSPESAKTSEKINYTALNTAVVEVDENLSSNDGVVFKAKGGGSTVIKAQTLSAVDYLQATVEGAAQAGIPYITVTDSVLEVPVGTQKHFMGTLQNGNADDYLSFVFSNREQGIINYEKANNTAVVTGLKPGVDVVTVKHPKAQYGVDVLVFVVETGEFAKYVTGENVVFMEAGEEREYYTRLVGVGEFESGYSVYQVIEGNDVVTVTGSGQFCYISSKKEGVAKLRVSNRSVPYPFEFQVIVRGNDNPGYISMSSNFVILENTEIRNIFAFFNGNAPGDLDDKYKWHFENNVTDIAEVTKYGNSFAIKALKNGSVKLIIENEYSALSQEVLILVQFEKLVSGEMFITTSQNVMHMELGGVDSILKMKLVGGTQADKNNFEWVVEDSSIIEAEAPDGHGIVRNRAIASFYGEIQEAEAKISAKKAGTTYIIVTNSSAPRSEVRVLVKVYPKGMFSGNTVSLGGPGLLKVKEGGTLEVNVQLTGGSFQNAGGLVWHVKDEKTARTVGAGLSGTVTGLEAGTTEIIVTGQNALNEYRAIILVYKEGQEDLIPYIYTDRLNYKMYLGQTAWVYVSHPNIDDEVFDFSIINTNTQAVYTNKMGSVALLNAVGTGPAELVINTGIAGCNTITLYVSVETAEINSETPYVITGDSSALTYIGGAVEYNVIMAGAGESDKSKISWSIDDTSVAALEMTNGTHVVIKGLQKGQTVLRAQSAKSANVKEVIVFVAATQSETYSKITLGLSKINYVVRQGESFFVKLITNATETQKTQIRWSLSDADIVYADTHYDTAFITAIEEGTCTITVDTRDSSHLMPLVLYVTVRSPVFDELEAAFPSSVALVKGQSKIIKGNVPGGGTSDFTWNLEDDNVAHVISDGIEATVWGRNPGQTFLTVSRYGFSKKILVICVENESDLENLWYFTADKTYFRIKKNEEARINLLFGVNGFPQDEKKNIEWREDLNNNIVNLSFSGESAKVTGKNPGVARIIAGHPKVAKEIEILVEVIDTVSGSDEYFILVPSVNRLVAGVPQTMPVSLYKGEHLYAQGYGLLSVTTEGKGIVQAELLNDTLRIVGWNEGREYVTLSHPLAGERRMLAVVYEGQIPGDDPIIYVDKTYWSVYEGKNEFIDLTIAGGGEEAENGILWVNGDPNVISLDSSNKTRAKITGLKFGGTEIDILFNGNLVEKLYVSVAKPNVDTDVAVSTESIIIMALDTDERHVTRAIAGGNAAGFEWSIENGEVAEITGYGYQCLLRPLSLGVTELVLSGFNYERRIIVVVVQTEKEKMEAYYLNIDKRYYRLKRGESTVLFPYYKTAKPTVQVDDPTLHYNSGVIKVEKENDGIVITGHNAGIELVTIGNAQCENAVTVAVEVGEEISGGVIENTNLVYMTTENNLMVVTPDTYGILVKIDVIGEYFGTNADFIWSKDSILAEWEASGTVAFLNTKDKTGEINITVENKYCRYPLKIKVIIEKDSGDTGDPYVYADMTVYRLTLTDDARKISFKVNNMGTVDYSQITFIKKGTAADISLNGTYFEVKAKSQGVSELEIGYPGAVPLKLYFIVADNVENTAVYLTTAMNYVVVPKSKTKVIDVSLVNYTELNSDNIKWTSSDYNTVTVVGNGRTVQAYGVKTGFAKLTVKHPASYNDLEIMVKVVEENDLSNVAYLTTGENIIETFVQNNTLQVSVNKVGGKIPELETTWTVDDPTVVSVMGSGSLAYLVPKKAGLAKITVAEKETEKLDIVVIVKEAKAGTEYISTDEPVVQISPGTLSSTTVQVKLVGGNENDTKDFEWQLYSQLPSDYEVAKNGGSVLSLFGMGDRATVQGNHVGTAKIRVTHPKAQLPLYIAVQVTNFNTLSFNEKEAVVLNGEIYFAGIRVPNYENYTGKVEYSTDNPAVCVVTGSDKVALLQSRGVGKANITAVVRGTDLQAVIAVNVIEKDNYAEPNIIVPKTTYLLNPRERPFQIEAYLQGVGVTEESRYGIEWEAMLYNGTNSDSVWDAISIYPSVEKEKEIYSTGEKVKILAGTGPVIQIEVLNPKLPEGKTFETKEIVIVVRQPSITSRTKTIYIRISEVSGIFTLDKSDILMAPQEMADLSCTILGGRASDYNEVVWIAEIDSVGRKTVEVLSNSGKDVRLFGLIDGTVYVTAIYRNEIAECRVQVKSSAYLKLQYEVFFTYPGARNGMGGLIEVEYEVRPFTTQITWYPVGPTPDADDPIAIVEPVMQDWNTGKGKIRIEPLKEGSFVINGMTGREVAKMTVLIKNVYRLQILNRYLDMQPGEKTSYQTEPVPPWDYDSKYEPVKHVVDNFPKIGDSIHVPFVICPPDHRLVFNPDTVRLMNTYGIEYEISPIVKRGEMEGRGIIKLTTTKEIPENPNGLELKLDLLKPLKDEIIDPYSYSSGQTPNNIIWIKSQLPLHQTAIIPVFQRVYGNYSNGDYKEYKYKFYNRSQTPNYLPDHVNGKNSTLTAEQPPASNFNRYHSNWLRYPTGVLPEFNNANYANSTSEYMNVVTPFVFKNGSGHAVTYELEIGDGEEHYILLDQTHAGMYYELSNNIISDINYFNTTFKGKDLYSENEDRAPSAEHVTINGRSAILVKGGKDFLIYDRVMVKNRKKITINYYSPTSGVIDPLYDVSEKTGIVNNKNDTGQFFEGIDGNNDLLGMDYYLVKRYGTPLKTTDEGIDFYDNVLTGYVEDENGDNTPVYETIYNESTALNNNVVFQIIYIREADPYNPIRVQYVYSLQNGDLSTSAKIIANRGNSGIVFENAQDFFKDGPLYVFKADGRGTYYIRDKVVTSSTSFPYYKVEEMKTDVFDINPVTSQINAVSSNLNTTLSNAVMLEYNPHFQEYLGGNLYVISDFDLGDTGTNKITKPEFPKGPVLWYTGFPDKKHISTYPPSYQPDSDMNITRYAILDSSHSILKWKNYVKFFYSLGNKSRIHFYQDYAIDGNADAFFNINNGKFYAYTATVWGDYGLFINDKSLFINNTEIHTVSKEAGNFGNSSATGFPYVNSDNLFYMMTELSDANWRAIQEMIRHNGLTGEYADLVYAASKEVFNTALSKLTAASKRKIFGLFANEKGTIMSNDVYIKREREMGHDTIYSLNEFTDEFLFHVPYGKWFSFYSTKEWILEDITGDNDNYVPVPTKSDIYINQTDEGVPLVITYKNSYRNDNKITIIVKHRIRANHNSGGNEMPAWDKLAAVKKFDLGGVTYPRSNDNFSRIYNHNNQGYFFVSKEYLGIR